MQYQNGLRMPSSVYIFIGGVYSIPTLGNEWYPRNIYFKGLSENKHNIETYFFLKRLNVDISGESGNQLNTFSFLQNYPNPFNPTTKTKFALPQTALTKLIIYDSLGREMQTPINKELEAGFHEINFDASNFTNGIYFCKIQSSGFSQTKKTILIK